MHIALGANEYGTMIGNPIYLHDHVRDLAEVDDLLKQHVYRIEIIHIIVQQQMLASALQEMRKVRYVSVLADEVTSRKTRRKALLNFLLLHRTDVSI